MPNVLDFLNEGEIIEEFLSRLELHSSILPFISNRTHTNSIQHGEVCNLPLHLWMCVQYDFDLIGMVVKYDDTQDFKAPCQSPCDHGHQ